MNNIYLDYNLILYLNKKEYFLLYQYNLIRIFIIIFNYIILKNAYQTNSFVILMILEYNFIS